ncbi:MAG: nucleotidyltransferase domain-containing protein [Chloroflexi bacterium]|nr:nucleotidyltransferase domain-containing protein [Chloroflexota bacterium]
MGSAAALARGPDAIRRFAHRLKDEVGATQVLLFGSQATGHARADSDYDLVVVADSFADVPRTRRGYGLRRKFYEVGGNAPLDLVLLTPDEFAWAKAHVTLVSSVLPQAIDLLAEEETPAESAPSGAASTPGA